MEIIINNKCIVNDHCILYKRENRNKLKICLLNKL